MATAKQLQQEADKASALIKATAQATADALVKSTSENIDLKLGRIQDSIGRMETDIKLIAAKDEKFALKDNTEVKLNDHETRVRRLELWGFIAMGVIYAFNFYMNFIHH